MLAAGEWFLRPDIDGVCTGKGAEGGVRNIRLFSFCMKKTEVAAQVGALTFYFLAFLWSKSLSRSQELPLCWAGRCTGNSEMPRSRWVASTVAPSPESAPLSAPLPNTLARTPSKGVVECLCVLLFQSSVGNSRTELLSGKIFTPWLPVGSATLTVTGN